MGLIEDPRRGVDDELNRCKLVAHGLFMGHPWDLEVYLEIVVDMVKGLGSRTVVSPLASR